MATLAKPAAKKAFASLAAPKDKITFADKIAGAKKNASVAKKGKSVKKKACMKCGGKMKK